MDRHQLAQRRYQQIAPPSRVDVDEQQSDQIEAWLREDVVPIVADLQENPRFRRLVTYGLERLVPGSASRERQLVQAVEDAVVQCALATVEAARNHGLETLLADADVASNESTSANSEDGDPVEHHTSSNDTVIEKIARRPWFAMGIEDDFLTPQWHLFLRESDQSLANRFRRYYPTPDVLGDNVQRMLFARMDFWVFQVDRIWRRLFGRLGESGENASEALERIFAAKINLDECLRNLRESCLTGNEPRLRNACCTLTQVYVAYHPCAKLSWLQSTARDLDAVSATIRCFFRHGGEIIEVERLCRHRFREVGRHRASLIDMNLIRQVAAALDDVKQLYHHGIMPEDLIEEARHSYRLLVVERPRMVFWDGDLLEIDWNNRDKSWELMLNLAAAAEGLQDMDRFALTGASTDRMLSIRKHELTKLLMQTAHGLELAAHIEKIRGGRVHVTLDPGEVHVLDVATDEWTLDPAEFASALS
jgi:hypothetical protein